MPELPEVETAVRSLREPLIGRTIQTAIFPGDPRRMTNLRPAPFAERIAGQRVEAITRRAKYLIFHLTSDALVVHLKMTGHLYVLPAAEPNPFDRWLRVRFPLDDGHELRFSDSRRFGRVSLVTDAAEVLPDLGPEPLDDSFTLQTFKDRLAGRSSALKRLLLDQGFIAGVGNIYADEALHIAGIHPLRTADSLTNAEVKRLYAGIRQALADGIRYEGASVNWYRKPDGTRGQSQDHLRAYRERGHLDKPCPVCGGPITKIVVGQRGTHFCAVCQPEAKAPLRPTKQAASDTALSSTRTRLKKTKLDTAK
jgi:formamidopyrimidine-DNA glycosylase